jgi:hypothetical protein
MPLRSWHGTCPGQVPAQREIFLPVQKKRFTDIDAKHKQKSTILPVWELAKDRLFILWLEDLLHGEGFLP